MKTYARTGQSLYRTASWAAARLQAKRRDGWKCVQCGSAYRLQVDHIKPLRTHPELALDLSNLQSLCGSCHAAKTKAEVGFETPISPDRQAWKALVKELLPRRKSNA